MSNGPRWAALTAAAIVLASCGAGTTPAAGSQTLRIAVVGPMTGPAGADGQHILQGARLAADEINGGGGITAGPYRGRHIEIVTYDDREDVQQSVSIAKEVVDDSSLWAFVGTGFSDAAIATAPTLDRAGVPYLSTYASSAQILVPPRRHVFVVPPTFPAYAFSAAERAYATGHRRVALLVANAGFGTQMAQLFAEHFTALGGAVVDSEQYQLGDPNAGAAVAAALTHQPDLIALAGLTADDVVQLKQLRQTAPGVAVIDTEAVLFSQNFLDIAGGAAEGVVGQTPSDPQRATAAAAHLHQLYSARYATDVIPDPTAFTYEAVRALAVAFESGPASRDALAASLHRVNIADTGIGRLQFDQNGARLGGVLWYFHVSAGKFLFDTGYVQDAPEHVSQTALQR
ncbi:MAG: ABC transporter substrate-binding protein [Candidatus Dormibacteria bacterium]